MAAICFAAAAVASAQEPSGPIQDNSFLVEEAYNQERGVVQHINLFLYDWKSGGWAWTFTQEWPVPDRKNQLSYTVLLSRVGHDGGSDTGLGDLALNYRYQLIGSGESKVAMAPRLTVFFPTGSYARSLGAGSVGVQLGIPVSVVLSDRFVVHGNVGALWTPQAKDPERDRAALLVPDAGASVVFLAKPNWNALVEGLWVRTESVAGQNSVTIRETALVSPGIRYAWNFKNRLQIVAGVGFPIGVGPSRGQYSVLGYLSFEHPMWDASNR
jgi:outer membrane putative beta-barrel porin/alpha-amylase